MNRFTNKLTEHIWSVFDTLIGPLDRNFEIIERAMNKRLQSGERVTSDRIAGFIAAQQDYFSGTAWGYIVKPCPSAILDVSLDGVGVVLVAYAVFDSKGRALTRAACSACVPAELTELLDAANRIGQSDQSPDIAIVDSRRIRGPVRGRWELAKLTDGEWYVVPPEVADRESPALSRVLNHADF